MTNATITKSEKALTFINEAIAKGLTVYIATMLTVTKVTPKVFAKWEASGSKLFKIGADGDLYMAAGKKYNCICTKNNCLVRLTAQ